MVSVIRENENVQGGCTDGGVGVVILPRGVE